MLPNKSDLKNWTCEPVILRLMSENRWPRRISEQWFKDFMCWFYSSCRWNQENKTPFMMDGMHYLDDVWHAYILNTKDYFFMCKELFGVDYIHHEPVNPFKKEPMEQDVYRNQLLFLLEEWGEEYIDRVWEYGANVSDLTDGQYLPNAI